MRFTGIIKFLAAALLAGALQSPPALADNLPPVQEPIFHLTLRSGVYQKGFPEMSPAALRNCGVAVKPAGIYRYWVLATAATPDGNYMILTGILKAMPAAPWQADDQGVFLRLSPTGCVPIDPADQVFAYYQSYAHDPDMTIGPAVFQQLAADAAHRYAAAFGSRSKFFAALNAQRRFPNDRILKEALEAK